MNVYTKPKFYSSTYVKKLEKHFKATYVLETCLKLKDGTWNEIPSLIFYTETAHPQGSNYLAITPEVSGNGIILSNGLSSIPPETPIVGILDSDGVTVVYSRYRHDYRTTPSGEHFIDGGRDYTRCSDTDRLVQLNVIGSTITATKLENE